MENVAVPLDEKATAWALAQAADKNMSLSRYLGELLQETIYEKSREYENAMRLYFSKKPMNLNDGQPYPKRHELYDRQVLR